MRRRTFFLAAVLTAIATPLVSEPQIKTVPPVAATTLQKLLPAAEGWTKGDPRATEVVISPESKYTYASATYSKGDLKLLLTLADTGISSDSLTALAMMVITLPDDYSEQVPPASTIKRVQFAGSPAAEMWDGEKHAGEITVLVGGRFVAKIEASKADTLDTLRTLLTQVDLKALAAVK